MGSGREERYGRQAQFIGARLGTATLLAALFACGAEDATTNARPAGRASRFSEMTEDAGTPSQAPAEPSPNFGGRGGSVVDAGPKTCASSVAPLEKVAVDVIFIIDSSGSMNEETAQVQQNINTFASNIVKEKLDLQVHMITPRGTPLGNDGICVPQPLGKGNCQDNPPLFQQWDQRVGSTNGLELFLRAYNQGTVRLRLQAKKVFVMVTDDRSATPANTFDAQLLAAANKGMFGDERRRNYIFNSIVGWQEGSPYLSTNPVCATAQETGVDYQTLSQLTGGRIESVCKTSYESVLGNIAKGITERQACELAVPVGAGADPRKVAVQTSAQGKPTRALEQVTDEAKCAQYPDGWYYDNNDKPTRMHLCKGVCEEVRVAKEPKVEAVVGCEVPLPR